MKTRVAVVGLGIFGREVAVSLAKRGLSVLAVDKDRALIEAIKEQVDQALILDTTNPDALYEARINEMDVVVCAIGNQHVEDSIMTTALLHQLGVAKIVVRAGGPLHERILKQVGAHEVINPEEAMAQRLAYQIASPGIKEALPLAENLCVAEVPVPGEFVNKTLAQLDVRRRFNINVIGVKRADQPVVEGQEAQAASRRLILNVTPRDPFHEGDTLVVIGLEKDVAALGEKG